MLRNLIKRLKKRYELKNLIHIDFFILLHEELNINLFCQFLHKHRGLYGLYDICFAGKLFNKVDMKMMCGKSAMYATMNSSYEIFII